MNREKFYFDNHTKHILRIITLDTCIQIYEYGRFNEVYGRVNMKFKLNSDTNTLEDLLDYIDEEYFSYNKGDELFITQNDKHYEFNPKDKTLNILGGEKYFLVRCCYKNIYRTEDHELYVLHDTNLNELFVVKKNDFNARCVHLCDSIMSIHMEKAVFVTKNYNRIKHFSEELQPIGSMIINLVSPYKDELEFRIKFHEKPKFEDDLVYERCCIHNMMQKIYKYHYDRDFAKLEL